MARVSEKNGQDLVCQLRGDSRRPLRLMGHVVADYPTRRDAMGMIRAMVRSGVSLIEVQIPFSEPMADGPTLLAANHYVLARGGTVTDALDFSEWAARHSGVPVVVMSYANPIIAMGVTRFAATLRQRRLAGAIVPDLPFDCDEGLRVALQARGLAWIPVVFPNMALGRLDEVLGLADSMVYVAARTGVTGAKTILGKESSEFLAAVRRRTNLVIGTGFGIESRQHLRTLSGLSDLAIVGSAAVRAFEQGGMRNFERFWRKFGDKPLANSQT